MSTTAVQLMVDLLKGIRWTAHKEALDKSCSRAALMVVDLDDAILDAVDERSWAEFHALADRSKPSTGND